MMELDQMHFSGLAKRQGPVPKATSFHIQKNTLAGDTIFIAFFSLTHSLTLALEITISHFKCNNIAIYGVNTIMLNKNVRHVTRLMNIYESCHGVL